MAHKKTKTRPVNRGLLLTAVLLTALIGVATLVLSRAATSTVVVNNSVIGTGPNQWQYTGSNWRHYTGDPNKYDGDDHGSSTAGDYATLKFSGVQATYYGPKSPQAGIVAISVDGGAEQMVDLYSATRFDNTALFTTPLLPNGTHTMKIRLTGQKNPAASDDAAAVDRAVVLVDIGDGRVLPLEAEEGTVTGGAGVVNDSSASAGGAIAFRDRSFSGTIKIMPLGDSITQVNDSLMGFRGYLLNNLLDAGYQIDYVGSMRGGPASMRDFDHEGHSGWRNSSFQPLAAGWVSTYKPDIIVYHLGTNDILGGVAPATAIANMQDVISKIYAAKPDVHIVLCKIVRINAGVDGPLNDYNNRIPGVVNTFAAQGRAITLADLSQTITNADLLGDGIHPAASGHQKMGNALFPIVRSVID